MLKLFRWGQKQDKLPAGLPSEGRSTIYLDAQHGLGNRLRAIASAATIAKKTNRNLVIVWEPDHHCDCRLSDLFEYGGAVLEQSFISDAVQSGIKTFNYMEVEEGAEKDAFLEPSLTGDIYVRSAYPINSPLTSWRDENNFLRSLKPNESVASLVSEVSKDYKLGVHVRMVGGRNAEHLSYEATSNWTEEGHEKIDFWRGKSHYSNFVKRIDENLATKRYRNFFLAADNPEAYQFFRGKYGDRVLALRRDKYDRSVEQLRYALADAILLSRSSLLLGSNWSSFTELAVRLSPHKLKLELSGVDF